MKFLFLLVTLVPALGFCCEPDAEQLADYFQRADAQLRAYVAKLALDADEIFVGKIVAIDDVDSGPFLQRAVIAVEKAIKGRSERTKQALMYRREDASPPSADKTTVLEDIPTCTDLPDPAQANPYAIKKTRALFYVKSGALVRIAPFPLNPPPMTPEQESGLVSDTLHRKKR